MAETIEVLVRRRIEQVTDGTHYKGTLVIADTTLDFELVFSVPISDWVGNDSVLPTEMEAFRRIFQISIKRDGVDIALTDDEFMIFFELLVSFTAGFYFLPQTRGLNEEGLEALFAGTRDLDASITIGASDSVSCVLEPVHREILNAPKFGCSIPAPA